MKVALSPQQWAESELSQPSLKEGRGHRPRVLRLPYHSLPSLMGLPLHSPSRGSKPDPQEAWLRAESSGTCWQLQKVQVSSAVPRDSTITQTTTRTPRAEHREGTLSWGFWHMSRNTCGYHTWRISYSAVGGDATHDNPENQPGPCPQYKDGLRPHSS